MSAPPARSPESVPSQDDTHRRINGLLGAVTAAVLQEQPGLGGFRDHRPQRDRSSGGSWRGVETFCHVSALLAASGEPDRSSDAARRVLDAAHAAATARGLHLRSESEGHGISGATWTDAAGDLLEVIVGVRVAVRAISAPFLPGSLAPMATTSPVTAISPVTPPPRRVR
jgi:hypothetical protein